MAKFLLIFFTFIFILSSSCGCSFIKKHLLKEKTIQTQEQETQQQEAKQKKKAEPIPVNPSHS